MKKMITNEEEPAIRKKTNIDFTPQKNTLNFIKNFARVYNVIDIKQVESKIFISN